MIKAKKSLGQNFLKNKKVLEKISNFSKYNDIVLEIGPGKGALTEYLLQKFEKVIAIEKDSRLIDFLKEKFSEEIQAGKFELFEGDALEINYSKIGLENKKFSIIANLPYYITGKFLALSLENSNQPREIILMLQKEIVERITGEERKNNKKIQNQKENILSISVKVYGEAKYLMTVSKKNFSPEPKIDSAVLGIFNISKDFFEKNKIQEKDFFDFIKIAFSSKRKKVIKNLSQNFEKEKIEKVFESLNLNKNSRAEDLVLDDFKNIFLELNLK